MRGFRGKKKGKKMKTVFYLPVRAGSERVKNKNTRTFAGIEGGLLAIKLRQLHGMANVDEIILSTNDPECIKVAERFTKDEARLRIIPRPDELCSSATKLEDVIRYVHGITAADHILWGHVTTPLVNAPIYDKAIEDYEKALAEGYDSLVSVNKFQNFLLDGAGRMVNNDTPLEWPRTQDLTPLYEINHAIFLCPRELYKEGRRTGAKPWLYTFDKLRSHDIDWEEDFIVGEQLYKYIKSQGQSL